MKYEVNNFTYNGMFIYPKEGKAPYKAEFIKWTSDPGVAECKCDDGEIRLIPSCQLVDF